MTEIDTAAIRADLDAFRDEHGTTDAFLILLNALDDARAERDMHRSGESYENEGAMFWKGRAEAAEANLPEDYIHWMRRARTAEARIAAALVEFGDTPRRIYMSQVEYKVYRALTEPPS